MSEAVEVLRQLLAAIDARESNPGVSEHWCCCGAPSLTEAKAKARQYLEKADKSAILTITLNGPFQSLSTPPARGVSGINLTGAAEVAILDDDGEFE